MPHVEHLKNLFGKEIQNENQVGEAIVQNLIDDVSSIVSEDENHVGEAIVQNLIDDVIKHSILCLMMSQA